MLSIWPTGPARPGLCRQCGAALIRGQSEGLDETCDAYAITPYGEFVVVTSGRPTFDLARGELLWRDQFRIKHPPKGLIVPRHVCGYAVSPIFRAAIPKPLLREARINDVPEY